MPDTPNIVFVHTDQQHHQALSAYGNKWLKTPHMDRIAKEGYNYYFRMCEMVDVEIGRIYDAIRRSRFAENTVFIFSSDHGNGTGYHGRIGKGYLLEEALRVPLIISWPDRYKSGVRDWDNLVTGLDIPATICELAGAPALPDSTQSKSLVPILEGKAKAPLRTYAVSESSQSGLACAVRDKTYKSILSPKGHELFNLAKDPLETRNLAEDSGHAAVLAQHKTYL